MTNPKIAIIGTGALACLFGARLSHVADVSLVGTWQAQILALQKDSLKVVELDDSETLFPLKPLRYPLEENENYQADIALVLVKSYQTGAVTERIQACLRPGGVVLTLQNGLGNLETLQEALPAHFVSAGITMQGGNIIRPGVIAHAGNGNTIINNHPRLQTIFQLLRDGGLPVQTAAEAGAASIAQVIWRKLIINAAINPLTALLGKPNGFLAEDPLARALCIKTAREAAEVARWEGVWPEEKLDEAAQSTVDVAALTAANRSSMLQDVSRGNRTEIEAICGEIVRRALKHGISAPINQTWLGLIQHAEKMVGGSRGAPLFSAEKLVEISKPTTL